MFTGIVECIGEIIEVTRELENYHFRIRSKISGELKVDQSVAHDGVCLTVIAVENDSHRVTAIAETMRKTSLSRWNTGTTVNLERCMPASGRFDGHIVQGHVDETAVCVSKMDDHGSAVFTFEFQNNHQLVVEKGSITVNGISLTCFNCHSNSFSVAIIPYTLEHTTMSHVSKGTIVNIEFDIIGKYVARMLQNRLI
ncbi:MAG: riboflavin synthase [Chitinophagales bacterium]